MNRKNVYTLCNKQTNKAHHYKYFKFNPIAHGPLVSPTIRRTLVATVFLSPEVFPVYCLHNPIFSFPISDFSKIPLRYSLDAWVRVFSGASLWDLLSKKVLNLSYWGEFYYGFVFFISKSLSDLRWRIEGSLRLIKHFFFLSINWEFDFMEKGPPCG